MLRARVERLDGDDGDSADAVPAADEPEPICRRGLDRHDFRRGSNGIGKTGDDICAVRRHTHVLGEHSHVEMGHLPSGSGRHRRSLSQQEQRVDAIHRRIIGGKMVADVPEDTRTHQGICDRMCDDVTIRSGGNAFRVGHDDTAQLQRGLTVETVGVEAPADP